MECRGVISVYDERADAITIWSSCQVVHWLRREASTVLNMPEARIRCVALDVGGGFGVKGHVYPEELLIPFLARAVKRPVRWIEDRHEHFMSACHSRDQIHDVEAGFDDDGRLLAFRDSFIADCGAWNPIGAGIAYNTAVHLPGPYKFDNFAVHAAHRRDQQGAERALSRRRTAGGDVRDGADDGSHCRRAGSRSGRRAAAQHGPAQRDALSPRHSLSRRRGHRLRQRRLSQGPAAGAGRHRRRRGVPGAPEARHAGEGRYLGLGLGCYVEGTGVGPFEGATVRIDPTGKVYVASGACPQGQGMETIFSQVVADAWKVKPDDVVMALADTSAISIGFGTIASRSTVTLSSAIHYASEILREKAFAIAANMLECAPGDLELRSGAIGVVGVPGNEVTLASVAKAARPGWDHGRPQGMQAGLEETYYYEPPTVTWSYASHAAIVEVDIRTGRLSIEKYVVVHDCGVVVNPMLVEGQIHGGTIQGLGGALLEEFAYDSEGQLLAGSFMDYLLPTASDFPDIELIHQHSPSPLNPLGVKGVGEGSAISPPVVIANAVSDALTPFKMEFNSTPIRPEQIAAAALSARR